MIFSTTTSGVACAAAACVLGAASAGCAAPAAAAPAPALRVVVDLVHGADDANAITAEATRVAGVPVRYAAATSATRHALVVECDSAERCDAALARLRAAAAIYRTVEIDGRKTRAAS
jgi:hypothetical protein